MEKIEQIRSDQIALIMEYVALNEEQNALRTEVMEQQELNQKYDTMIDENEKEIENLKTYKMKYEELQKEMDIDKGEEIENNQVIAEVQNGKDRNKEESESDYYGDNEDDNNDQPILGPIDLTLSDHNATNKEEQSSDNDSKPTSIEPKSTEIRIEQNEEDVDIPSNNHHVFGILSSRNRMINHSMTDNEWNSNRNSSKEVPLTQIPQNDEQEDSDDDDIPSFRELFPVNFNIDHSISDTELNFNRNSSIIPSFDRSSSVPPFGRRPSSIPSPDQIRMTLLSQEPVENEMEVDSQDASC